MEGVSEAEKNNAGCLVKSLRRDGTQANIYIYIQQKALLMT